MNNFELATRLKVRFDTPKGLLPVEDLWDLPLTSAKGANLDDIARQLHLQLRSGNDISFVNPTQKSDSGLQLKFDLVKHIIDTRLADNAAAAERAANKEKKQKIMDIIAAKQDQALSDMSVEDLRNMIDAL